MSLEGETTILNAVTVFKSCVQNTTYLYCPQTSLCVQVIQVTISLVTCVIALLSDAGHRRVNRGQLDCWTRAGLKLDMNFRHEMSTQERKCEWFQDAHMSLPTSSAPKRDYKDPRFRLDNPVHPLRSFSYFLMMNS